MCTIQRRRLITVTSGDSVHHPHHGIGTIQSIRTRSFSGDSGGKFAKLFFERDEITLILREQDLEETVREPIKKREAMKVIEHLESWSGKVSESWKARANAHQAKIDDGDPFALAEVYKTLARRREDDALSAADRKHLSRCEEFLSEELAVALNKSPAEALERMAGAISN